MVHLHKTNVTKEINFIFMSIEHFGGFALCLLYAVFDSVNLKDIDMKLFLVTL